MPEPWAAWGAMVVLGAGVWPWLRPEPERLVAALLALTLLTLVGRRAALIRLVVPAAGLLLGLLAPAVLPEPPDRFPAGRVVGTVVARRGAEVDLDADIGRLRLRVWHPPAPGMRIAAWVRPAAPRDRLPGEPDPVIAAVRARRARGVVRQWVPLGAAASRRSEPYRFARHRNLLRALTGEGAKVARKEDVALLTRTGTRHLLAVSGLHIGLVAGFLSWWARWLLAPLSMLPWVWPARVLPVCAGVLAAAAFAAHAGAPTSARRALLMFSLGAVAWLLGRRPRPSSVLGLVAGGMVLVEPGLPGDLGFRLSFGAVTGLLLVTPRLLRWLPPDTPRVLRWCAGSVAATVGASMGTLPDAAWTFQSISPVSPLSNLVALPLLAGVAVPSALVARVAPDPLGTLGVALADGACAIALDLLERVEHAPWTPAVGPLGAGILVGALFLRRRPAVSVLLVLVALALRPVPAGRLAVTFLPVGQGDAALLEHPDGRRWLVDGGPPGADVLGWLRRSGVRALDAVVLSHPHPDHMAGLLPVLDQISVRRVFVSRPPEQGEAAFRDFWLRAWASGAIVGPPEPGEGGVRWLHPRADFVGHGRARVNDESLVLEVGMGERRILFTGDIERAAEGAVGPQVRTVDVVKAPHHGSRTSSTPDFVAALEPGWVVLSVGTGNRFGHPHPIAVGRWAGARRVRTDRDGAVRFTTDGSDLHAARWDDFRGWIALDRASWTPRSPERRRGVAQFETMVPVDDPGPR